MEEKADVHGTEHCFPRNDDSSFDKIDLCIRVNAIYQKSKALLSAMESESGDSFSDEETLNGICKLMRDYVKEVRQLRDEIEI